jgi:hypothetical protein
VDSIIKSDVSQITISRFRRECTMNGPVQAHKEMKLTRKACNFKTSLLSYQCIANIFRGSLIMLADFLSFVKKIQCNQSILLMLEFAQINIQGRRHV